MRARTSTRIKVITAALLTAAAVGVAVAADVISNGDFASDLSGWTPTDNGNGSVAHDGSWGGAGPGSASFSANVGRNTVFDGTLEQPIGTISPGTTVWLSFAWSKDATTDAAGAHDLELILVHPDLTETVVWSETTKTDPASPLSGTVAAFDVGPDITTAGAHAIKISHHSKNGRNTSASVRSRVDDVVVDVVSGGGNAAPTLNSSVTAASPASIQRSGANATTLSATFDDTDAPPVGDFSVTFRVQEPDNSTVVTVANAAGHGAQGVTIIDNGSGNYTASVDWDPGDAQALGVYDLYFEVSDGTDNAVDDYAANPDELTLTNLAPTIVASNTSVSPASVQAVGANPTTMSATFTDGDQPGIDAFNVTFKAQEPDDSTEVTIANAAGNGAQGVTIVDNGGGSYTASVVWDPGDAQAVGVYDLYFEVSDGTDNAIDGYAANPNELTLLDVVPNEVPVVAVGATSVAPATAYPAGAGTVTLSAAFSDADVPGVGAFNVGFSVQQPDNSTVVVVVSNSGHGTNGVTISDSGGGNYVASVSYNPDDALPVGPYDLYFEVSDGFDSASDGFVDNPDELTMLNRAPTLATGNTASSPNTVNRYGTESTTISSTFTDLDQPGLVAFAVTFRIREPDDSTVVSLAEAVADGAGGVTIIDNGGGSYTASIDWDPGPVQALGDYDLYFEVSDGVDVVADIYDDNLNNLSVFESIANTPPTIAVGATSVSPSSLDRLGAGTTELSVVFSDTDGPGIGAFTVDLVVRVPYGGGHYDVAAGLQTGQGGLTITDQGGNSYRASINWDPPDDAVVGYYDLEARVSDGQDIASDLFDNNPSELLITAGGENQPPIVQHDETSAAPSGIPRVGATTTTISAVFMDPDAPAVSAFTVTFKVREPDNSTEVVLAADVAHGAGGVTISDLGGGIYLASIDWDPGDAQAAGFYDLHFEVSDGQYTSDDVYRDNEDELQIFDDIPNQSPTTIAGNTEVSPTTITRFGAEYTMLRAVFTDPDEPGLGTFTVTFSVRDPSSGETLVVNAAQHGIQSLRIRSLGGDQYDAAVLWDPPVGQTTGVYDLSFTVQDAGGLSATDGYVNNADELTITAIGVAGDGYLLRRSHNADSCGGPTSGCHNILDHMGQNCLTCHTPHGSSNIFLVREIIGTPSDGDMPVVLKTTGIGDPYNDPDPTIGDATSGVMADDSDGVFTAVCEVCHKNTDFHRNDGTQPIFGHHNAEDCDGCHPHTEGFPRPEGDPESGGGQTCSCHSGIGSGMTSGGSAYHHLLSSMDADYTISARTCLTCHVDHDIFRPDLNTGVGARAKNLRVDITTPVVQGDAALLSDSDYISTGSGGICLSCHVTSQTKGYVQPDGTTQTPALSKADFDAATSSHNFDAPTVISDDLSTFRANCVKCHDDDTATSYQEAGQSFATHTTPYRRMLNSFGAASPSDPLEEKHCFGCHSTSSNPNAGSNLDYFAVKTMSTAALALETVVGYAYSHPITTYSGRHKPIEGAADLADGATRHVECTDCHNPHAARAGVHDGSSTLVSNPLKGAWGVEPTWDPVLPVPTDNANVYSTVTGYTRVEPAVSEYQICLKCHSDFTTLPTGARDLAEEINPAYESTHGIAAPGTNAYCNTTTMNEPWASSGVAWCSDCHRSDNPADPNGPHGSNLEHLLVATVVSDNSVGTPLCYVCHKETVYWSDSPTGSKYGKHPPAQSNHKRPQGCFACHMWEFSSTPGLGENSVDDLASGTIFVHGMNKKHVYNDEDGSAGTGEAVDAFVGGYIANISYVDQDCWAQVCKNHSGTSY